MSIPITKYDKLLEEMGKRMWFYQVWMFITFQCVDNCIVLISRPCVFVNKGENMPAPCFTNLLVYGLPQVAGELP